VNGCYANRIKRLFDFSIASLLLVIISPIIVLIIVSIKIDSHGAAFFTQERIGMRGRPFRVVKFRSMLRFEDSNRPDGTLMDNYERVTRVGGILRRTSFDEVPQLFNVIKGEMSLVGPRPTLPYQVEKYSPSQLRRLDVRPGLTGLAQVSGRNRLNWSEKIQYDLEYVDRVGLATDFRILLRTARAVVSADGLEFRNSDSISDHTDGWLKDVGGDRPTAGCEEAD
jgi:lipopolysaccharide/colanic/teichoic acid biosynthesis glycosyltransferase